MYSNPFFNKGMAFSLLLILLPYSSTLFAQEDLNILKNKWQRYSDIENSLYNLIEKDAVKEIHTRNEVVKDLQSLDDWQKRQECIKHTLDQIVGSFPEKKPLNAIVTKVIEKDKYKIEHIVFESQPNYFISSSLFIPKRIKGKAPAILYCSGHAQEGYRSKTYMHIILNLVNKGFIVYAYDPVGQGERIQYLDNQSGKSIIGGPVAEHSFAGAQLLISGNSLSKYMIWDGIRAIDYLYTRKEVDVSRIGIAGRSGGGTQAAYIAAFDNRIKASAIECYITNFTRLFESIGPQDAEQNFTHGIKEGIDHADLLEVRAPKPTIIITTTNDFFSIQGARETEREVINIYNAYGKRECFRIAEDDAIHISTPQNREAMYAFFQEFLNNPGSLEDGQVEPLNKEDITVTKTGQILSSFGGETVFSLNYKESNKLFNKLRNLRKDISKHLGNIKLESQELTGYQKPLEASNPVFIGRFHRNGYVVEKYFLKGSGDYVIPYLLFIPDSTNNKSLIYLHPEGKNIEAGKDGEIEWFVKRGFTVLAPDIIGTGETGPGNYKGDSYINGISYNILFASVQTGKSIVGIRAKDIVKLSGLIQNKYESCDIYALAKENLVPVLIHAAVFDTTISHIALVNSFSSYRSVVMNKFYESSFIYSIVPGVLNFYDLPDLEACLAPRKLLLAGITDGAGKSLNQKDYLKDFKILEKAYKRAHATGQLETKIRTTEQEIYTLYSKWIK